MHFTNVLFSLLDNAVKYRSEERVPTLTISTEDVNNDTELEIRVSDNGIGIKKDDLKRIFERFYRVSTGNRHDVKGFGIGLAYVKEIVDRFKGSINVESEYDKGTTFIIRLPLCSDTPSS
jgi:signal transduction histidine kinase